jgi:heme exporter protein C
VTLTGPEAPAVSAAAAPEAVGDPPGAVPDRRDTARSARSWTGPAALGSLAVLAAAALVYAPGDVHQGPAQRIFYIHVPAAFVAFAAFTVVFGASIAVLVKRSQRWDQVAVASAEVGVVFMTVVMITGPLWGRPVWGVYWSWDPRLTSSFVLWLIFVSYLALRGYVAEPERRARYAAVLGIVGFLDVPLVYFSVRWWRALHPEHVVVTSGGPQMPGQMVLVLLVGIVASGLLALHLVRMRLQIERLRAARAAELLDFDDEEIDR